MLKQSSSDKNLLQEKIHYTKNDLNSWHPITGKYINSGTTLETLSTTAISYSDNPAFNLIMQKLGGPQDVMGFAHIIGNSSFNIEHYEGNINSNPKIMQDNSTPKDMAISVQKLTLGNALTPFQRIELVRWMRDDTVAYKRICADVLIAWVVADKTGTSDYGIANDIGILWSSTCKPIVLAIYTIRNKQDAKSRDDIVASTTSIILNEFAKNDPCFKLLFS